MKFSELWLREWVNLSLNSEALSDQITMAGLQVDSVKPVASFFNGVIVGEVLACSQYQKDNELRVIKVDIGTGRTLDIICRSQNCYQDMKVAVATIDAILPGYFKIKSTKLHNELSEGMLCSYSSLGILEDNKIIELPSDAPIGIDIREYLKLDDNIIEISVTPNRADCLSIIGIARDVAAFNRTKLNVPSIVPVAATINDILPIQIESTEACPRYLSRVVKGINNKAMTPLWMKEKLRRCGIHPINPVIDIANYILFELGQPINVFDKDYIDGGIVVRMAKEGETLFIDGNETKLSTQTLVIADHNKALAMGGIVVSEHASVKRQTKNVLLECAFFNQLAITSSVRYYSIHTDASRRYERGVDPELQYKAIERATYFLLNICGGEAGPVIEVANEAMLPKKSSIMLYRSKLDRLIGHHIADEQVIDILERLGCKVILHNEGQWKIIAPSWRFDIEIEEDLVEEITRVYGYNNIPNEPVQVNLKMSSHREADLPLKRVKMMLNDKGYQEVITYGFIDPKLQQLIHPETKGIGLLNPISKEMSVMRVSLWSGLLSTITYNQNRQQNRVRIFETGLCFIPDNKANLGIRQDLMLAGAICGNRYEEHWDLEKREIDFYDMKGDLEAVLDLTGKLSEFEFRAQEIPALHFGQSAAIYLHSKCIGFIGVIHPRLEHQLNLNGCTIVFELEWSNISERLIPQFQEVSRFPVNRRDIAIVVADDIPAKDVLTECKKIGENHLIEVNLFDVYRGKGIEEGYKSLAISLILQDTNRTLKEEEIASSVTRCVEALKKKFQASLRDCTYVAYKR